jgi:hypothetical protein
MTIQNTMHAVCMLDNQGYTHTHTHSEYVIFIAFRHLQWLTDCASMLWYSVAFNCIIKSEDDGIRINWGIVCCDEGKHTAAGRK